MQRIMSINAEDLEALAKPLVEYLNQNYHPHIVIVITSERVVAMETMLSVPQTFTD